MKLLLTLLVRDEEDIIEENIRFHLNQGVDFIIVTDNNSVDSTPKILKSYEQKGVLHIINEPQDDYSQSEWVTRMAQLAYKEYNADWVINSDADEFWWPKEGNLKETFQKIPKDISVLEINRHDFIPLIDLEKPFYQRMIYKKAVSINHLGQALPPKVCHRGFGDVIIKQGNHLLIHPTNISTIKTDLIEILHFPMRSFKQFENKIKLGGAAYERNTKLNKAVGGTWRRLYENYQAGTLEGFYKKGLFKQTEIDKLIQIKELTVDTRLRDYLIEHQETNQNKDSLITSFLKNLNPF
ncbi:MAG: glycosyltransferase [Bacteroidales bacterium]|nr:glycosyltransferase [Bacteroidales bacterium]